jgi:TRAP-type uncharacterized transport system fused permease subunit
VWVSIDLEARKLKLRRVPPEEIPPIRSIISWSTLGPNSITIAVLLASLFMGHTPTKAAFLAIATNVLLFTFFNPMTKDQFLGRLKVLLAGVEQAGRGMVTVVSLLVCAQITISMISMTGLGIKLSEMIIGASAGHIFLALILAAMVSLILGMGMPTTAAYVLSASVVGPALSMIGVNLLSAHMFAVFTAATIAEAHWLRVAGVSIRLAIMKYIIPFFFVYRPSILLMGRWYNIIGTIIVSWMSATMFAIGSVGFYRQPINPVLRVLILAVALTLILQGLVTDLIGVICMSALFIWQRIQVKRMSVSVST